MDNDPDAALKGAEKIAVHLEGQPFAFPGGIGGGRVQVTVRVHAQQPSCRLKATASA